MSLLRNSLLLLVLAAVGACGFTPVYQQYGHGIRGTDGKLAQVKLGDISHSNASPRVVQMLRTNLGRELNPDNDYSQQHYVLDVVLDNAIEALGVKQDKEITRYNLNYVARYTLRDLATGRKVVDGRSRITGSYDAVASDFGTFAAQRDIEEKILVELAKDIKLKLTSHFLK